MKNATILSYTILILFASCDKDNDNNAGTAPIPIAVQLDSFPLSIGNSWKYHTVITLADTNGVVFETTFFDNYWSVVSDTIINGVYCAKVSQLDSNYNGTTHLAYGYYSNQPDGLYGYAYWNYGSMFLMRSIPQHAMGFAFTSAMDTLYVPDSALKMINYAVLLNSPWHVLEYNFSSGFFLDKMYEGFEVINTSAGLYNTVKTKVYFNDNGNVDTLGTQYFSQKGLIKETVNTLASTGSNMVIVSRVTELVQVNF